MTVTNAAGCSATSAATGISTSQITAPTVTSNGALEFCDGASVGLALPVGYSSFMWNNGSNFSQITATTSGDYYAQVMNSDGCTANSDTVTVTVFPTPPAPTISYTANDTVMTSSESIGNQWYFNGNVMPGETGQTLRPLNLGNYSVQIIDTNDCEGNMSALQFYNSIGLEESLADQIKLYPNPTAGQVSVDFGKVTIASVELRDMLGRVVSKHSAPNNILRLDVSDQPAGIYMLLITTRSGAVLQKTFGKQN